MGAAKFVEDHAGVFASAPHPLENESESFGTVVSWSRASAVEAFENENEKFEPSQQRVVACGANKGLGIHAGRHGEVEASLAQMRRSAWAVCWEGATCLQRA